MWWICSRAAKSPCGKRRERGGALIAAIFLVIISLLLATGYVDTLTSENKTAKENESWALALYAADAGIQYALEHIRAESLWNTCNFPKPPPNDPDSTNCGASFAPPHGVEAVLFTTSGGLRVSFRIDKLDANGNGSRSDSECPGGTPIDGLSCYAYRATGTVTDPSGRIVARKLVDAILTISDFSNPANKQYGNVITWNEHFI